MSKKPSQVLEKPIKKLTKRQKLFVYEYAKTGNATKSAEFAGYSKTSSHVIGPRLLGNVSVAAEIDKLTQVKEQVLKDKFKIDAENILGKLAKIAFADIKNAVDVNDLEGVVLKESDGIDSIKIARGFDNISIKMKDNVRALQLLGEHIGLFGEKEKDDRDDGADEMLKNRVTELFEKFRSTKAG
jgi:phage terminase small subunit